MMKNLEIKILEKKAKDLRRNVLDLSLEKGEAHLGGSFSEIEILISLYNHFLREEDKFILSKGHCSFPLYLLLRKEGYNPKISTHPDIDIKNRICATTGSLGHGLPIGTGMAFAKKFKKESGNIYVLMGDGECQEGTLHETMPLASKYELDNLTVVVDNNKLQAINKVEDVSPLNLKEIFSALGGEVYEINGHSFPEIFSALNNKNYGKPKIIIADTIKGKGISFMENDPKWHTRLPNKEELKKMREELK